MDTSNQKSQLGAGSSGRDIVLRLPDGDQVIVPKHLVKRSQLLAQVVDFTELSGSLPVQRDLAQSWISMASNSVSSAYDSQLTLALQVWLTKSSNQCAS
jgi:hypothetical protein